MDNAIREMQASIEARGNRLAFFTEENFKERAAALDFLELAIDRIEGLLLRDAESATLAGLHRYAESVQAGLKRVDEVLFCRLRQEIASGSYTNAGLASRIAKYASAPRAGSQAEEGYDTLDALVNGILLEEAAPESTGTLEPQMVFYQPTPARIVWEMVERVGFQPADLFYDIGSGLGQVAILVHLLTGIRSRGVEIEPAYAEYAQRCASRLNLSAVEFIGGDARTADYADGSIFFLYTPFVGTILKQVLERLRQVSTQRRIRLCTFGPCTLQVARHEWVTPLDQNSERVDRLALFSSGEEDK